MVIHAVRNDAIGRRDFLKKCSAATAALGSFDFEDGRADSWQPNHPENWRVVYLQGSMVYELTAPGPQGQFRSPASWSVLTGYDVTSFVFIGRLKCRADPSNPHRDLCIFFHYQDPAHFGYVHFSASSDDVHNIIGLVNGADRVRINREPAGQSVFRLADTGWHEFKVTYDARTGEVQAFLDDPDTPVLTARRAEFSHGLVGVGSFDDTGCFDDIRLWGSLKKDR